MEARTGHLFTALGGIRLCADAYLRTNGIPAAIKTHPLMLRYTIVLTAFLFTGLRSAHAQTEAVVTKGSVFEVRMVKTIAHSQEDYLQRLNAFYLPVMRKAEEQGLIKSFKVLAGPASNDDDYDVLLLVEHTGMGFYDTDAAREAKWKAIEKEMVAAMGGADKRKSFTAGLDGIRHYQGQKFMREVTVK